MGKDLIQQRRGKGSARFRAPSFNYKGKIKYPSFKETLKGEVKDIIHCRGHSAPLILIKLTNGNMIYNSAPKGISVGEEVTIGDKAEIKAGNILPLENIPEGTQIYNIELIPGDGGRLIRAAGSFGYVVTKTPEGVKIRLPSNNDKILHKKCRATIGSIAGGGKGEKPMLKAGKMWHKSRQTNKFYPIVKSIAMNAVDHPFGGGGHPHIGKPETISRHAPPGRKVGKIAARRSGKR